MPYHEDFDEFAQRMGCPFVVSRDRWLFRNGGQSNGRYHDDPPTDESDLARLKHEYFSTRLEEEEKQLRDYRAHVMDMADTHSKYPNLPTPPDDAPEVIRAGRRKIRILRAAIEALEEKLKELPEQGRIRSAFAATDDTRRRHREYMDRLHEVLTESE